MRITKVNNSKWLGYIVSDTSANKESDEESDEESENEQSDEETGSESEEDLSGDETSESDSENESPITEDDPSVVAFLEIDNLGRCCEDWGCYLVEIKDGVATVVRDDELIEDDSEVLKVQWIT